MSNAMSGKLFENMSCVFSYICIVDILADQDSRSLQRGFAHQVVTCRGLHTEQSFESIQKTFVQLA